MKLRHWGIAALAACFLATTAATLRAESGHLADYSDDGSQSEQADLASYQAPNMSGGPIAGGYGGGFGVGNAMGGLMDRPIQLVFGAEYIYAQATFSEALAFVSQDAVTAVETFHNIEFDYESSYSFYGGVYLPDCGGAVIFDYTRLTSSGDFSADDSAFVDVFGPFENDGNIRGDADVDLNSFDVGFSKTIPLGCLLTCGKGCGDCADACCDDGCCSGGGGGGGFGGGGWCPAWDITWGAGVRFADVDWTNSVSQVDPANNFAVLDNATTRMNFDGFGGRVGLMGRRYLGKRGLFSLYGRGDWSVLFGDREIETAITRTGVGTAFIRQDTEITVPVTEIELGSTAHLGAHASLSAGYFWSAWHDLGMSPTYDFEAPGGVNRFEIESFDDANILGWNGFFARAEVAF